MQFVILMRRRHLNNMTFLCVSQTRHTKEVEQHTHGGGTLHKPPYGRMPLPME